MIERRFSVYGDAESVKEGTRIWPKQILVREKLEVPDAWLVLLGIQLSGICVVGIVQTGRRLTYERVSWDPKPEPPGHWGQSSTAGGSARWLRVKRKTRLERIG